MYTSPATRSLLIGFTILFGFTSALWPPSCPAADLTVHYHHRPPYYITTAGGLDGLVGERVNAIFAEAGVTYTVRETPPRRQMQILRDNSGSDCMVGWFLIPEREKIATYSRPIYEDRPQLVLARQDNAAFKTRVDIAELLAEPSLHLLVRDSYSYGSVLDALINKRTAPSLSTGTTEGNMAKMIHARRADYMFLGAEEAEHIIASSELPRNDFRLVFPDGMPPTNKRYLLFSKSVDQELIRRINNAIDRLYPMPD